MKRWIKGSFQKETVRMREDGCWGKSCIYSEQWSELTHLDDIELKTNHNELLLNSNIKPLHLTVTDVFLVPWSGYGFYCMMASIGKRFFITHCATHKVPTNQPLRVHVLAKLVRWYHFFRLLSSLLIPMLWTLNLTKIARLRNICSKKERNFVSKHAIKRTELAWNHWICAIHLYLIYLKSISLA